MTQYTNQVSLPFGTANDWVDLGLGPLQFVSSNSDLIYAMASDTQPVAGAKGDPILPSGLPAIYNVTAHIWAKAAVRPGVVSVTVNLAGSPANIATNQVTVGTTATLIVPARPGRKNVTLYRESGMVRLGAAGVTVNSGIPIAGKITIKTAAAIFGVSASTAFVSYVEIF